MQIMDNKSIVYVFWGVVFILLLNITTNFEIKCQVFNNAFLSKGDIFFLRARGGWGVSMIMVEVFAGLSRGGRGFDWLGGVA